VLFNVKGYRPIIRLPDKRLHHLPGVGFGERPSVIEDETRPLRYIPIDDLLHSADGFLAVRLAHVDSPSRPIPATRQFPALRHLVAELAAL
jgi:hypothetical protein